MSLAIFCISFLLYSLRVWNCYIKAVSGYLELIAEIFPEILNPFLPVNYSLSELTLTTTDLTELEQQHTSFRDTKKAPKQDTGRYLQLIHIYNEFCYLCLSKGGESFFKLIQLLFTHLEALEVEFY